MLGSGLTSAWTALVLAGVLEVGWAIGLKYTDGFSKFWPSHATIALMAASFSLLSEAMRLISVGTAYAIWTGIGAVEEIFRTWPISTHCRRKVSDHFDPCQRIADGHSSSKCT